MARPKLNEELIKKAGEIIAEGNFAVVACDLLNISEVSWYDWARIGTDSKVKKQAGKKLTKRETLCLSFLNAIKEAEARAEQEAVQNIRTAGREPKHWQANAWYLERKYPQRWSVDANATQGENPAKKIADAIKGLIKEGEDNEA